jgi:hypothetical protein
VVVLDLCRRSEEQATTTVRSALPLWAEAQEETHKPAVQSLLGTGLLRLNDQDRGQEVISRLSVIIGINGIRQAKPH